MATETSKTVDVLRYDDAETLGRIELDSAEWASYAAGQHPAFQWPQGIADAGDVLTEAQIETIGLDPETTIYLDA